MNKPLIFILSFLLLLCVTSLIIGAKLDSASAFALSGAALLPFVGIFAVGVLDYKVGGSQLTLEKRVNSLEKESTELKEAVTALLKSLYVLEHGSSLWEGTTEKHYELVSLYLKPIEHLISGDVRAKVISDMSKFHDNSNT